MSGMIFIPSFSNGILWMFYKTAFILGVLLLFGCANAPELQIDSPEKQAAHFSGDYLIGPGDGLNIFVWRHPEVSVVVPVRPDGKVSTPLVEDVVAAGKTSTQLARDIEDILSVYIKQPKVTVIIQSFGGGYDQRIRVVGQAMQPQALGYRDGMTLLDVMISVGGLTEYAAGNRAVVMRTANGVQQKLDVDLEDLLEEGNVAVNIDMMPGDILVIPQSWF